VQMLMFKLFCSANVEEPQGPKKGKQREPMGPEGSQRDQREPWGPEGATGTLLWNTRWDRRRPRSWAKSWDRRRPSLLVQTVDEVGRYSCRYCRRQSRYCRRQSCRVEVGQCVGKYSGNFVCQCVGNGVGNEIFKELLTANLQPYLHQISNTRTGK
jgi:hypothetical protein